MIHQLLLNSTTYIPVWPTCIPNNNIINSSTLPYVPGGILSAKLPLILLPTLYLHSIITIIFWILSHQADCHHRHLLFHLHPHRQHYLCHHHHHNRSNNVLDRLVLVNHPPHHHHRHLPLHSPAV